MALINTFEYMRIFKALMKYYKVQLNALRIFKRR